MKRLAFLSLLLVISTLAYSQKKVNIGETEVWMIAPEGVKFKNKLLGFELGENAGGKVYVAKTMSYYDILKEYLKNSKENKELKILENQDMKIGNYAANFQHLVSENGASFFQLLFGDANLVVKILGY